jgi:hypothetical protein
MSGSIRHQNSKEGENSKFGSGYLLPTVLCVMSACLSKGTLMGVYQVLSGNKVLNGELVLLRYALGP